jgi:release factor glutamine methyltransferase
MDIRTALKKSIQQLRDAQIPSYTLAAELLLRHALGRDRSWIYAHPEAVIDEVQAEHLFTLISRRVSGEPTQYIIGKQEFWSLEFEVAPGVLIPRPETEHVVEVALDRLAVLELRAGRPTKLQGAGLQIADIGTGSGCLAIALAKELPGAAICATDISAVALGVARRNAERHGVSERIRFVESNFLEEVFLTAETPSNFFNLIVCNPPYVGRREAVTLSRDVREHEPDIALYGGEEGYELYPSLISRATAQLQVGGIVVLELGHNSLPAVQPLFDAPEWINVGVSNDLAGIPRMIAAERTAVRNL